MLSPAKARDLAADLERAQRTEWARLRRLVRYAQGKQKGPWLPDTTESEYHDIAKKAATNLLDLVVRAKAQGLVADGYGDRSSSTRAWTEGWQRNGMDARQVGHVRATLTCGYGFVLLFPAADDEGVWMRPEAATNIAARYADPDDEWPTEVLRVVGKDHRELYDSEGRYTLRGKGRAAKVTRAGHDFGRCPVVQTRAGFNLLGPPVGVVEPVLSIQDRIIDATFTLQMVAKYGAFPQRWVAGLNPSEPLRDPDTGEVLRDADGNVRYPNVKAYVDSILSAVDPEARFGQFAAADLSQYVTALEAHIRHLAVVSQVPSYYLLGDLVNVNAETIAATDAGYLRSIGELQQGVGEGYEQLMRGAAEILGDDAAANDVTSQMRWRTVERRALSQVADAITKLADHIPRPQLLELMPGWTEVDVARALAEQPTPPPPADPPA